MPFPRVITFVLLEDVTDVGVRIRREVVVDVRRFPVSQETTFSDNTSSYVDPFEPIALGVPVDAG